MVNSQKYVFEFSVVSSELLISSLLNRSCRTSAEGPQRTEPFLGMEQHLQSYRGLDWRFVGEYYVSEANGHCSRPSTLTFLVADLSIISTLLGGL
jgi:hypothetical protein